MTITYMKHLEAAHHMAMENSPNHIEDGLIDCNGEVMSNAWKRTVYVDRSFPGSQQVGKENEVGLG